MSNNMDTFELRYSHINAVGRAEQAAFETDRVVPQSAAVLREMSKALQDNKDLQEDINNWLKAL